MIPSLAPKRIGRVMVRRSLQAKVGGLCITSVYHTESVRQYVDKVKPARRETGLAPHIHVVRGVWCPVLLAGPPPFLARDRIENGRLPKKGG